MTMNYQILRAQVSAALETLRQQVEVGLAPPGAEVATLYAEQLVELEAGNAPIEMRVRAIQQVLCAIRGQSLPLEDRGSVTA